MAYVNSYLSSVYWNDEYRNGADISRWGRLDEQKVVPFLEVFLPQAICSAVGFRSFPSKKSFSLTRLFLGKRSQSRTWGITGSIS